MADSKQSKGRRKPPVHQKKKGEWTPIRRVASTRYGVKDGYNTFVGTERRFEWQKPVNNSDVFYNIPDTLAQTAIVFGTSTRADWEATRKNKRDSHNPNAGPGNYQVKDEYKILSTQRNIRGGKFGLAGRQGMALKTDSPGPTYKIENIWRNGKDKKILPGFNLDNRKELADNGTSRTDAMYNPQLPRGKSCVFNRITQGKSFSLESGTPGPIYNMLKYDFRTGPKFSFGLSKTKRFEDDDLY